MQTAVQATKLGAFDFIEKPLETERVLLAVRNASERKELEEEVGRLRLRFERHYQMVGESTAMQKVEDPSKLDGMILMNHGIFTFHKDAKKSYELMIELVSLAEKYLAKKSSSSGA